MGKRLRLMLLIALLCIGLLGCTVLTSDSGGWEKKLLEVPLGGEVKLAEIFPFEWDEVEIVNGPMGAENFDWGKIHEYDEKMEFWLASTESMSALIFYEDGNIVENVMYNFANSDACVFRPYPSNNWADDTFYSREQAVFRYAYIGEFCEHRIFLPVDEPGKE